MSTTGYSASHFQLKKVAVNIFKVSKSNIITRNLDLFARPLVFGTLNFDLFARSLVFGTRNAEIRTAIAFLIYQAIALFEY